MKRCGKCGAEWTDVNKLSFRAMCPKCHAEMHACINCRLYDPYAANRCRSRTTEPVRAADRANFCEEFDWREDDAPTAQTAKPQDSGKKLRGLLGD